MPTTTATDARVRYPVPADQLTEGQVLRDYYGRTLTVSDLSVNLTDGRVSFLLTDAGDGEAVRLNLTPDAGMVSWLAAQLPGLDPITCRCATCDSRGCGLICARPWVADRA